jgi:TnsA endonuclease N terminal
MSIKLSFLDVADQYHEDISLKLFPSLSRLKRLRNPSASAKQSNTPGLYFFSSLRRHIYYESYLESTILLHLEFQGQVEQLVEQPFVLHDHRQQHIPDFVVQYMDDSKVIVNVKPQTFLTKPDNIEDFDLADRAAAELGWTHRVFSELAPQYLDNLLWLSGYKSEPYQLASITSALKKQLKQPRSLQSLLEEFKSPLIVKPFIFHLLWMRQLFTKINQRFTNQMPIWIHQEVENED